MATPAAEREAVAYLKTEHETSERRACQLSLCCRITIRYASVMVDDTNLHDRMKTIAHERRRFGYRRIYVLLRRKGVVVNQKRLFRFYREERLSVRKLGGRKLAFGKRAPMLVSVMQNQRLALDFCQTSSPIAAASGFWL